MPTRKILFAIVVLAGATAGLPASVVAQSDAIFENAVEPEMTPRLQVGKLNYDLYCSSCHGKTARGSDKGPTFISRIYHPGHHGDKSFFVAPKQGTREHHFKFGEMKPVKGVTDAQLSTILDYVRAVQKANGLF
ncbi:MAG: c-type cytochrome [Kiloniellales bacterium]